MSATDGSPWMEREDLGKVAVLRFKIPRMIDEDTIRDIFDPIKALIEGGQIHLVFNFALVEYLPSMALGKLVMLNRKVQTANGRLVLCAMNTTILESLENTHLAALFHLAATEPEALQSFA
jgi:anti-sigma B factor antagonist